jgi:hypothetical protein
MAEQNRRTVNGHGEVPHGDVQITPEQFQRLHRDVQETKWLVHTVLVVLIGMEKSDKALKGVQGWLDDPWRRFGQGTAVYNVTWGAASPTRT